MSKSKLQPFQKGANNGIGTKLFQFGRFSGHLLPFMLYRIQGLDHYTMASHLPGLNCIVIEVLHPVITPFLKGSLDPALEPNIKFLGRFHSIHPRGIVCKHGQSIEKPRILMGPTT